MKFQILFLLFGLLSCDGVSQLTSPGIERSEDYLPLLKGQNIAVVSNHTGLRGDTHLVDYLLAQGISVKKIFSPEHGFRGDADAGAHINNAMDSKTQLPIVSLYGNNKKPTVEQLKDIDIVVFDIQDVGVRFYTYISTLHYVMEACAQQNKPFIVLDRPNPNAYFVDGPMLQPPYRSFVGMHPVPVVYGMTIGEYARMINGEGWLDSSIQCALTVVPMRNFNRQEIVSLPVAPSPNLPSKQAVALYPSLCFFEGTVVSVGRGTHLPFEIYGHPDFKDYFDFSFTPQPVQGKSANPPLKDQVCYGENLSLMPLDSIVSVKHLELRWLINAYQLSKDKAHFFTNYFDKLAGTDQLRQQIINGVPEAQIRASWQGNLEKFLLVRQKYLLYE